MAKILQWNCQSVRGKLTELEYRSTDYPLILLPETWIRDNERLLLRNYDTIKSGRGDRNGGGVAILVRNGIKYQKLSNLQNIPIGLECCAIVEFLNNKKLTLISCYKPPMVTISVQSWVQFLCQFKGEFIIGGDLNSHHSAWGGSQVDKEGQSLFDALLLTNAVVLNDGTLTRYNMQNGEGSAIDITISSPNTAFNAQWKVNSDSWGSDHRPIIIEIQGKVQSSRRLYASYRACTSKTDWAVVCSDLEAKVKEYQEVVENNSLDIQVKYATFYTIIEESILAGTPQPPNASRARNRKITRGNDSYNQSNSKITPWWNEECEKVLRLRKAAKSSFQHRSSSENFIKYKRAQAEAKRIFRKAKRNCFSEFCKKLNRNSNMKFVWQTIRGMANKFNRSETFNEYNPLSVKQARQTIEDLCPPWVEAQSPNFENCQFDAFLDPLSREELDVAIASSKMKSSPGTDGIDYKIIRLLPEDMKNCLLSILNEIFVGGIFPVDWHQFAIFFIPKKDSQKFRPISMAQCMLKVAERIIMNRLYWWVEERNLLPQSQYGFRKEKSCADNLAMFTSDLNLEVERYNCVAALFVDVQGGFGRV